MQALNALLLRASVSVIALALLAGCPEDPAPQDPEPLRKRVGIHEVEFVVPPGWTHFDHGSEQRFHKGLAQIALRDLGPFTPAAYRREIKRAQRLFREGQPEDARELLRRLDLEHEFDDVRAWRAFLRPWNVARDSGLRGEHDSIEVENAYIAVLSVVDAFEERAIDELVEAAWLRVDTAVHRAVAETEALEVSGHDARRVSTWDTLSHDHRKTSLFVVSQGNLLVLGMELGDASELEPAFEVIAESLSVAP